ncbi:hypothetical protein PAMP_023166 [Pampus punctatissimus]
MERKESQVKRTAVSPLMDHLEKQLEEDSLPQLSPLGTHQLYMSTQVILKAQTHLPALVFLSQQIQIKIQLICEDPRYGFNGKLYILIYCKDNLIGFYGSVSLLLLLSCITYLFLSVLSIFLSSDSPEEVIHRSGILAVFSLSPASSSSVTWLKTDVEVINGRHFDPSLRLMTGIAPINPMIPSLGLAPPPLSQDVPVVKEIIHYKSCTLFPPNPNKLQM